MSTRERKIRFIQGFGAYALHRAVEQAFRQNGPDWLTDEQLDEIVHAQVADYRATQHRNMRNRAIARKAS